MKRKRAVKLGIILGLIAEFIYIMLSIPTGSGPMFIHYSSEAMRDAVIPEGFPADCAPAEM